MGMKLVFILKNKMAATGISSKNFYLFQLAGSHKQNVEYLHQ